MKKLIDVIDATPYLPSSSFHQPDQTDCVVRKTLLDNSLLNQGLRERLNEWIERYYREREHLIPPLT